MKYIYSIVFAVFCLFIAPVNALQVHVEHSPVKSELATMHEGLHSHSTFVYFFFYNDSSEPILLNTGVNHHLFDFKKNVRKEERPPFPYTGADIRLLARTDDNLWQWVDCFGKNSIYGQYATPKAHSSERLVKLLPGEKYPHRFSSNYCMNKALNLKRQKRSKKLDVVFVYENNVNRFFCSSIGRIKCRDYPGYKPKYDIEYTSKNGIEYDSSLDMLDLPVWKGKIYSNIIDLNQYIVNENSKSKAAYSDEDFIRQRYGTNSESFIEGLLD